MNSFCFLVSLGCDVIMLNGRFDTKHDELCLQRSRGMKDPLEKVAEEFAEETILLCIDEFMVCF